MFYDTGKEKCRSNCRPGCHCEKFVEIWNDVFMEFNRLPSGKLKKLEQQNIDTGMGVDRTTAVLNGFNDNYKTELFSSIIRMIEEISGKEYQGESIKPMRIIADHLRAAVFLLADGVLPSNVDQGYILRRLVRRSICSARSLQLIKPFTKRIAEEVIKIYKNEYRHLSQKKENIFDHLQEEEKKFIKVFSPRRFDEIEKIIDSIRISDSSRAASPRVIEQIGEAAFNFFATYGTPAETFLDIAEKRGCIKAADREETTKVINERLERHQQKSRASLEKKFAGGLADHSQIVTRLHTATHLLHQALRDVLGDHIKQVGSNITVKRLRFDFTHPEKLTDEQIKKIEKIINEKIDQTLPIKMEVMTLDQAKKKGALAFFGQKYGEKVKVYSIGPSTGSRQVYSCEACGGPHVENTSKIGHIKIRKEEGIGAGRRRIYAFLEKSSDGS